MIIGQSGSGKSVLLKHIIALMRPDSGQIFIDGVDITEQDEKALGEIRKNFGMLFQGAALFDSMTVGQNVAFPIREHTDRSESKEIGDANMGDVRTILGNFRVASGQIEQLVTGINEITAKINRGEGTLGRLVQEEETIENLKGVDDPGGKETI